MTKPEREGKELPKRLLPYLRWSISGKPYTDRGAFEAAVKNYQDSPDTFQPQEVVLPVSRVAVQFMCWKDGDQVEPVVELATGDGRAFTAGEFLFQLHNAVVGPLGDDDHHHFEGLTLTKPAREGIPLYYLRLGS
jgi:hypothetical protein